MKPIEAVFEQGQLKPLQQLSLAEHQHVWVMILTGKDLSSQEVAHLAAASPSFQFLADPAEERYSLHDGQPV